LNANDIPLDDARHENKFDEMVASKLCCASVLLKRDYEIFMLLKGYLWMNGASVFLAKQCAHVL